MSKDDSNKKTSKSKNKKDKDNSLIEPIKHLRKLWGDINKVIEDCRMQNKLGSSLEAAIRIDIKEAILPI